MQILVLVNFIVSIVLAKERFDWHKVLNIVPRMERDVDEIIEMEDQFNITHPTATPSQSIFIHCGIHAREWISPSFCLNVINMLLDETEDEMLQMYNWQIVPVLNPDGYQYSHTTDRMWRKNRRETYFNCRGVDLNRNFGYGFNAIHGVGVQNSINPCSQVYVGPGPFSEPETLGLKDYIEDNKSENFLAFLSVHSYAQVWLYPWGYTATPPADQADLENAANNATDTLKSYQNTTYEVGSTATLMYLAAGVAADWAKGGAGIKYSYTLELRDKGQYGFALPETQIRDTVMETWEGVKALARYIN